MSAFYDMVKSGFFNDVKPDLKSIKEKGRPKVNCPKWYAEGIEQGDLAYQTNEGWFLRPKGEMILNPDKPISLKIQDGEL